VLQAGQGMNCARQVAIGAGVPVGVPSFTVNKVCGSSMKAMDLGWQRLLLGRGDVALVGGTENMSMAPYLLPAMRAGARLGNTEAIDHMVFDGLTDIFNDYHMGVTAENIAEQYEIGRDQQDEFAAESQRKCGEAMNAGRFKDEITPFTIKHRKGDIVFDTDEYPKPDTTAEGIARLRPAFKKDGSVTAANASGINDGAAAALLVAEDAVPNSVNTDGALLLRDVRSAGCDPKVMGLGPIYVVRKLLDANNLTVADIDLWELNEAFAVQSIACVRDLGLPDDKVNVNGGAIALGHPIGCSGMRIVATLKHEMNRRGAKYGIAAMCIGGGQGIGCLIENPAA